MIILPNLTTSLILFSLEGWENVLFELGSERVQWLESDRLRARRYSDVSVSVKVRVRLVPLRFYRVLIIRIPAGWEGAVPEPNTVGPGDLVSYKAAQQSNEPAVYVAVQFKGTEYEKYKRFLVGGGDQTDENQRDRRDAGHYYNGPLEPTTRYRIFARGFTSEVSGIGVIKGVFDRQAVLTALGRRDDSFYVQINPSEWLIVHTNWIVVTIWHEFYYPEKAVFLLVKSRSLCQWTHLLLRQ